MLPYRRQDRYGRELRELALDTAVLENAFLRAEFVPALGGRLWSLRDLAAGRDLLYANPVLRPANLAIRDAWFSGGIEWNIGRLGHAVHTCAPVFSGIVDDPAGGAPSYRIWEFERQTRLYWSIDFRLSETAPVLFAYVRVVNPDAVAKPLYWWTNAAVPETDGVRVLAPAPQVIYIVPSADGAKRMGGAVLPHLPTLPGADASYPSASDYSNEYFFQSARSERDGLPYPWEAAVYEDGYAYAEASTAPLSYRKMFCWGSGRGGRRWQDFLSLPGERYLEVQAGLAPTQLHTADIGAGAAVDWAQAFCPLHAEPLRAHGRDYGLASAYLEGLLAERISPRSLESSLASFRGGSMRPPRELLSLGSGWGALERRLAASAGRMPPPAGLPFPDGAVGADEGPWLSLIEEGALPRRKPSEGPGAFAVGPEWEALLAAAAAADAEAAPAENAAAAAASADAGAGKDWLLPYHRGVAAYEAGRKAEAEALWEASVRAEPNAWALRNLAVAARDRGDGAAALDRYRRACALPEGAAERALLEELIPLTTGAEAEALLAAFPARSDGDRSLSGPLLYAAAALAYEREDDALLDELFSREPARIREGENTLSDLWFLREARRLARREGLTPEEARVRVRTRAAAGELLPPREIDFRMFTEK